MKRIVIIGAGFGGLAALEKAISYAKVAYLDLGSTDSHERVYALNQYLYYMLHAAPIKQCRLG